MCFYLRHQMTGQKRLITQKFRFNTQTIISQDLPGPTNLRIAISRERPNQYHTFLHHWKARKKILLDDLKTLLIAKMVILSVQ